MTLRHWFSWVFVALFCALPMAANACYEEAAEQHDVPVDLLKAIAKVESGGNPNAIRHNKDGSANIGLMQISTRWLPTLAKLGITRETLKDACTNVRAGAWILARYIAQHGSIWTGVEAYHAGYPRKSLLYSRKVQGHMPAAALALLE